MKLRNVAEILGVAVQTISNIECAPHRVVGEHKAIVLAEMFRLGPNTVPDRGSFMAAWEATPISRFSADRAERFKKLNEGRNARRRQPRLEYALCCLAGMHIGMVEDDARICVCEIGPQGRIGDPCEVCEALSVLGLDTYSTREHAIDQLATLQGKLEAARAAAQNGATP